MTEVHAAFRVIHSKRHITIVDEDNGVSVANDLEYVMRTLRATKLLRPNMKVLLKDAFGLYDALDVSSDGLHYALRDLEAPTEQEALKAA